ncbi:hypothetical protein OIV83_005035 [Microbotryomycetes sp. JL201]|nr:hypothetical protein OIV83_005035 [Microbotryomycetes sp. JL201]
MAPRFYVSPFKNALANVPKRDGWWSELPVSSAAASDSSDLIKTSSEFWLAQGTQAGTVVCLPYDPQGKLGHQAPTIQLAPSTLSTFDVSRFDDLIVAGTTDGKVQVVQMPTLGQTRDSQFTPTNLLSLSMAGNRSVDTLATHPTSNGLFAGSSSETVCVWDVQSGSADAVYSKTLPKACWSSQWSYDGRLVSTTGKDNTLRLWDVRSSQSDAEQSTSIHAGVKASRHVWLGGASSHQILTTGFSRMREREYSLYDSRQLTTPVKTQRVDSNMGVLMPVVDQDRSIVYLAGRGDMTVRWVEIGGPSTFTEGNAAVPLQIASVALAPPSTLSLMKAEINRLLILSSEAVVPVPVEVPRRQYVDFHVDLYPTTRSRAPAQDAAAWRAGNDGVCELLMQNPSTKPQTWSKPNTQVPKASVAHEISSVANTESTSEKAVPAEAAPRASATLETAPLPTLDSPAVPIMSQSAVRTESIPQIGMSGNAAESATTAARPVFGSRSKPTLSTDKHETNGYSALAKSQSAGSAGTGSGEPFGSKPTEPVPTSASPSVTPRAPWSRKFLEGKTPLKPDYHDVHGLSSTMSPDAPMFKANRSFFFFPLAGPGGRLGVHPVAAKGRLPTNIPALVCGATIVNFELDPFNEHRVFVGCDDSKVRVFEGSQNGFEGDTDSATLLLTGKHDTKMDRINALLPHPAAKDLLLTVSDDHGKPTLRLWNVSTGAMLRDVDLPAAGSIISASWSPRGDKLVLSSKQKKIVLLDPRDPSSVQECTSHQSVRPVHLTWISDTHVLSSGFSRSASREVIVYEATDSNLSQIGSHTLDVSPAPLFPFYDLDTNILLLYSRGERTCLAYEVQTHDNKATFTKLPHFEHGNLQSGWAFLPKKGNDVKGIEIISALRLTQSTVERVSFTVPRAKAEYFQDDIFVPTRDVETPTMSADGWLQGQDVPLALVDLQPESMKPLSAAPKAAPTVSTRSKIGEKVMTDSQRQDAYMDRLFQAAKNEGDDEEVVRSNHAPVDDDDW